MPSFTIHLAVAKRYLDRHQNEDADAFYQGVIAPDLHPKPKSHYGSASSDPDLKKYKTETGLNNSYDRGYYLHLLTDYLFYHDFIEPHKFSDDIYGDYDRLNRGLVDLYELTIPEEVKDKITYSDEIFSRVIDRRLICYFIDFVGGLEFDKMPMPGDVLCHVGNCIHQDKFLFPDDWEDICEKYYELAAEKGHCEAMCRRGILYANEGIGWYYPEMDCGEPSMISDTEDSELFAKEQYEKAIENGYPMAYWLLGRLYLESNGTYSQAFNDKEGRRLLKLAEENGVTDDVGRAFQFRYKKHHAKSEQEKYNLLKKVICDYIMNHYRYMEFRNVNWKQTLTKIREVYILQNKKIQNREEQLMFDKFQASCQEIVQILCEIPLNYAMAVPKGYLQLLIDIRSDKYSYRSDAIKKDFQDAILHCGNIEYTLPILAELYNQCWHTIPELEVTS